MLSLRTAGAGLGTCLSLPNVGYNPPPFSSRFGNEDSNERDNLTWDDWSYNTPRRLEAFWPQSKVLSVQTGHSTHDSSSFLTPKCKVTGENCSTQDNPDLTLPSTRLVMEFNGPTRRSGIQSQSLDVCLVGNRSGIKVGKTGLTKFISTSQYVQSFPYQDLQTFFKEIMYLAPIRDESGDGKVNRVVGAVRVAGFLPKDASNSADYNDSLAVVLYDYKIKFDRISKDEASQM
jgi:hypothetical protein